jgi:membrane protein required for colicin V production
MNWLDIVIIVVLILSIFMGYRTGLIRGAFLIAGIIIGVVLAGQYSDDLGAKLTFISDPNIAGILAFIIILIATLLVALLIAYIIQRIAHWTLLNWIDAWGGALLGLVLGAFFIGAILAMWLKFQGNNDVITSSALGRFLVDKFTVILGLLPSEFQGIRDFF